MSILTKQFGAKQTTFSFHQILTQSQPIQLDCEVQHNIGSNTTSIQIHQGALGVNGQLIFKFNSFSFSSPYTSHRSTQPNIKRTAANVRNVFEFKNVQSTTAEEFESDFLNGNFYIVVNSNSYPNGIIRAQIQPAEPAFPCAIEALVGCGTL